MDLDVNGYMRMSADSTYDVWIQGAGATTAGGDGRNLALLGVNEANGDYLIINYGGEYQGGTQIHTPLTITGGNGGNVPHNCVQRSTSMSGTAGGTVQAPVCLSGEFATGGGLSCTGGAMIANASSSLGDNYWWGGCNYTGTWTFWARCCQY
jgi:hypothetical protein